MLLQQQQKQHCLFTKHKTDRKTNNIIHQIAQQQKNYYKTNIYENHYFTWIFCLFFKHHKRTFCLLFKTFMLLKPFFYNYYWIFIVIIFINNNNMLWAMYVNFNFCDNYYIFKYYFLVFINKVFALNQFVFTFYIYSQIKSKTRQRPQVFLDYFLNQI